jgi:hypothetical protein
MPAPVTQVCRFAGFGRSEPLTTVQDKPKL